MQFDQLKRREFITLLGGAAVAWPQPVNSKQADRLRRVGVLVPAAASAPQWKAYVASFKEGLQKLGWSDGHNIKMFRETRTEKSCRKRAMFFRPGGSAGPAIDPTHDWRSNPVSSGAYAPSSAGATFRNSRCFST